MDWAKFWQEYLPCSKSVTGSSNCSQPRWETVIGSALEPPVFCEQELFSGKSWKEQPIALFLRDLPPPWVN